MTALTELMLPLAVAASMLASGPAGGARPAPLAAGRLALDVAPSPNRAAEARAVSVGEQVEEPVVDRAEPDFTLVALPTAARLPRHGVAFRVTHRFGRPLNEGSFGSLAGDLFGLDSGAQIGLELRFAPVLGTEAGVLRTNSDKTVTWFGRQRLVRQGGRAVVGLDLIAAVEGTDNFRDRYSPSVGALVSRKVGDRLALYVEPMWVGGTNPMTDGSAGADDTVAVGVGGRVRVGRTVYLVGEVVGRATGYAPGTPHAAFGLEKVVGGHVFQLNVSNSFAMTPASLARGGETPRRWYFGFNLSRKFY